MSNGNEIMVLEEPIAPAFEPPAIGNVEVADELGFAYLYGGINFGATGRDEIFQNVRFIILTEYFSCPLDREFGLDYSLVDKPMHIAEAILAQEVTMKITFYEPRVQFQSIDFERDELSGKLSPSVKVQLLTTEELPSRIPFVTTPAAAPGVTIEPIDLPGFYETMIELARVPGPSGPEGPEGDAATIEAGTTTTGAPGTDALVVNVGDEHFAIFDFTIPQGDKGDQGTGITVKGTVPNSGALPTTGNQPGDMWIATDTGHGWTWDGDSWVDAGPIQGPVGPQGPQGTQGIPGNAATATAGTTTTGAPGTNANVINAGTSTAAVFNFTIPRGDVGSTGAQGVKGDQGNTGATGPSNVLSVQSTTTGTAGTNANVTIAGTSPAQTLAFIIPRGDVGATGATGPSGLGGIWRGTWNSSTSYIANDAVEYQGSSFICTTANTNSPPVPDTGSNWLPPLANTGNRGSLAALPVSNQASYYARGDNTFQLFPDLTPLVGSVVQNLVFEYSGWHSSAAQIPLDNTIPQSGEGLDSPFTITITPRYANSVFDVQFIARVYAAGSVNAIAALFRNAAVSAIAADWVNIPTASGGGTLNLFHRDPAQGSLSPIIYKMRYGPSAAVTIYLSGLNTAALFGGVQYSSLRVQEIKQ